MSEEEYQYLKNRLIADFWAWLGHKLLSGILLFFEYLFKALGYVWPFLLPILKKYGLFDYDE